MEIVKDEPKQRQKCYGCDKCKYILYPGEDHTTILVPETQFMLSHPW